MWFTVVDIQAGAEGVLSHRAKTLPRATKRLARGLSKTTRALPRTLENLTIHYTQAKDIDYKEGWLGHSLVEICNQLPPRVTDVSLDVLYNQPESTKSLSSNIHPILKRNKLGNTEKLLAELKTLPDFRSFTFNSPRQQLNKHQIDAFVDELVAMPGDLLPHLIHMSLLLNGNWLGHDGIKFLTVVPFHKAPKISSLNINLSWNNIANQGMESFITVLKNFPRLKHLSLDLSYNYIGDAGIKFLALALENLPHLEHLSLNLSYNYIHDAGIEFLAMAFKRLPSLKELDLILGHRLLVAANNNINTQGAQALAEAFKSLQSLTSLCCDLYPNNIGHLGAKYLVEAINTLPDLKKCELYFLYDLISCGGEPKNISKTLKSLKHLTNVSVFFHGAHAGSGGAEALGDFSTYDNGPLQQIVGLMKPFLNFHNIASPSTASYGSIPKPEHHLTHLSFNFYQKKFLFMGRFTALAIALKSLPLTHLSIDMLSDIVFGFNARNIRDLSEVLKVLPNLTHFNCDLHDYMCTGEGIAFLVTALKKRPELKHLSLKLHRGYIDFVALQDLATVFDWLKDLAYVGLDLYKNKINFHGLQALMNKLKTLKKLKDLNLNLHDNSLDDGGEQAWTDMFTEFHHLESLKLGLTNCNIGGEGLQALAKEIGKCPELRSLTLFLGGNATDEEEEKVIMEAFSKLPNIKKLGIHMRTHFECFLDENDTI